MLAGEHGYWAYPLFFPPSHATDHREGSENVPYRGSGRQERKRSERAAVPLPIGIPVLTRRTLWPGSRAIRA